MGDLAFACVVLLLVLAASLFVAPRRRAGFVASREAREIAAAAQAVFRDPDASYKKYRARVPGADPVQFSDVRQLARAGQLTPARVERLLAAR